MQDRFVRGYIAGAIGGVAMVLINLLLFKFGITETRHIDLISIVFLGHIPYTTGEQFISLVIQLGHTAIMGISFAYLVPTIKNEYLTFKGATYGVIIWFTIFSVGSLFKIPLFYNNSWLTISSYLVTSSIWGVVTSLVLFGFEKHAGDIKENHQSSQLIAAPAYKHYSAESYELDERLDHHEKLLMQIINEQQKSKRSFLSRFRFW